MFGLYHIFGPPFLLPMLAQGTVAQLSVLCPGSGRVPEVSAGLKVQIVRMLPAGPLWPLSPSGCHHPLPGAPSSLGPEA